MLYNDFQFSSRTFIYFKKLTMIRTPDWRTNRFMLKLPVTFFTLILSKFLAMIDCLNNSITFL